MKKIFSICVLFFNIHGSEFKESFAELAPETLNFISVLERHFPEKQFNPAQAGVLELAYLYPIRTPRENVTHFLSQFYKNENWLDRYNLPSRIFFIKRKKIEKEKKEFRNAFEQLASIPAAKFFNKENIT